MQETSPQTWLEHLRSFAPVQGLVQVGAGTGASSARFREWDVPCLVLVEADQGCQARLSSIVNGHEGWSAHTALVGDVQREADYYVTSNPNENGTIPPEQLTGLWRNLQAKERRRVESTTLDRLLSTVLPQPQDINWAVIDCLPAVPILQGAAQCLNDWDVVVARVVLDQTRFAGAGSTKPEVDRYLATHGYRCVGHEEERHPALGIAMYVRDWKGAAGQHEQLASRRLNQLEQLGRDRDETGKVVVQQLQQLEQLVRERNEYEQLAAQRLNQLEQLGRDSQQYEQLAAQRLKQLEQLGRERDETAKAAAQQLYRIEQLGRERAEYVKLAAQRLEELEQSGRNLEEAAKAAAQQAQRLDQLGRQRDEYEQLAAQRLGQLEQIGKERDELGRSRDLMARLAEERLKQIEEMGEDRDVLRRLAEQRLAQLGELGRERDAMGQLAEKQSNELSQLRTAYEQQATLAAQRQQQLAKLSLAHAELTQAQDAFVRDARQREKVLEQQLDGARQTAALSVKLQTLREADLQELQVRYQASLAAQERQHQLLSKLSERLSAASNYFHQLTISKVEPRAVAAKEATSGRARTPTVEHAATAKKPKKGSRK